MTIRWRKIEELGDERHMICVRRPNDMQRWQEMTIRWRKIEELGDERRMICVRRPNDMQRGWHIDLAYFTKGGVYKTSLQQLSITNATHFFVIEDVPE